MKASLSHYRQSPRKVRLIADLIRGKDVARAQRMLAFADKKSAPVVKKLLESAVANARNAGIATEGLIIAEVRVDSGVVMKRFMPRARGSAGAIHKRTSRIHLTLGEKKEKKGDKKASKIAGTKAPAAKKATPRKKAAKKTTA